MAIKTIADSGSSTAKKKKEQEILKALEEQAKKKKESQKTIAPKNTTLTNNVFNNGISYEKILYDLQTEALNKKQPVNNEELATKAGQIFTKQYANIGTPNEIANRQSKLTSDWQAKQAEANKGYFNNNNNTNMYGQPYSTGDKIYGSVADAILNIDKGILSIPESFTDLAQYGYSALFLQGDEKKQYDTKISESWTSNLLNPISEKATSASVFGNKSDSIAQSIGYNAGMMALQSVGVPWQLTAFVAGVSNGIGEAYGENATTGQAFLSGLTNGMLEVGTEYISSGIKLPGTGKITSEVLDKATKNMTNGVAKFAIKYLGNIAGEIAEEEINNLGHAIGRYLIYNNDNATLWDNLADEDWVDTAISTAFSTGVLQTSTSVDSLISGRDINTGLTQNEEDVVQAELKNRIGTQELSAKEQAKIENQVREDLNNGNISIDVIENTLGDKINFAKDSKIELAYAEKANSTRSIKTLIDGSTNENVKNLYKSAEKSGINNTAKARTLLNNTAKIIEDTGIKLEFTNEQELSDLGLVTDGKTISSVNINGVIKINAKQSTKALETVIGNEVANYVEQNTNIYETLKNEVVKYAKLTNQYNSKVAELTKVYEGKDVDIEKELTNNLIGEYLFGDNNFIKQLATNRNMFEKVFDNIKHLTKVITTGKEAQQLETIKTKFEEAYKKMDKNKVINENIESNSISQSIKTDEDIAIKGKVDNLQKLDQKERVSQVAQVIDEHVTPQNKELKLAVFFNTQFVDKGYYVDKLGRMTKNKELYAKYEYQTRSGSIADSVIGLGRYDLKTGEKTGDSLINIFKDVKSAGLTKEFYNYMYNKLNIDRMTLSRRYNESNKPVFTKDITAVMSENTVRDYDVKYPQFEEWSKKIYEYENANLALLKEYGVLSQDQVEYLKKKYPHYVPLNRVQAGTKIYRDFKRVNANIAIKKAVGGEGDILALDETMATHTISVYKSALRNSFGLELYNVINENGEVVNTSPDEILSNLGDELIAKKDDVSAMFTAYRDGEKIRFNIDDNIYSALTPRKNIGIEGLGYLPDSKILMKLSNIRRNLLTEYSPFFTIKNGLRDVQDVPINSKFIKDYPSSYIEAIKQMTNNGDLNILYEINGGSRSSYFSRERGFDIQESKIREFAPLKAIITANDFIEKAPRLAEFISTLKNGGTIEQAIYNSAEITTNFNKGGDITKYLNRNGATFLNASVQGLYKQINNIQQAKANGWKATLTYMAKFALMGAPMLVMNNLIWKDDEDYDQLSDYVKDNYYVVWKYDGKFVRIPKGRVSAVIQNILGNAYSTVAGDVSAWDAFTDSYQIFMNNLAPNNPIEENILAPIGQVLTNTAWYGGDLVPLRLQKYANEQQYDETTDTLSKWLGQLTGQSPYKIHYLIDQYSGVIGDIVLPYLTPQAEAESSLLAPISSAFISDSVYKNQYVSDFYTLKDEIDKNSEKVEATDETLLASKYLGSVNASMNDLYAQKRELQNSDLPDAEKYNAVRAVQQQIVDMASYAMDSYDDLDIANTYAEVGGLSYYKNNNGEWTKLSADAKIEIDELGLNTQQKSAYYQARNEISQVESTTKKKDIVNIVKNANMTDEAKIALYDKTYNTGFNDVVLNTGIKVDTYLDYASQDFEADKNYLGESISGSRRTKVIAYINSLSLSIPQKAMLIRNEYSTYTSYDNQIIDYLSNQDITYDEEVAILKQLGFTIVDGEIRS